ncbi:MAG: hypothetical protein WAU11_11765 [Ignavibacteriaceae bacterium]
MNKNNKISDYRFPNSISDPFVKTSEPTYRYNCIAWSVGDDTKWWWPHKDTFWPDDLQKEETLEAFIRLYARMGYELCDHPDYEDNYEKLVLFADDASNPTHAARQLPNGKWTSKLGPSEDVEHSLKSVSDGEYGKPVVYFKRKAK